MPATTTDAAAMTAAADKLAALTSSQLEPGPLKGLLFGDPARFVNDLVLQLRASAAVHEFHSAVFAEPQDRAKVIETFERIVADNPGRRVAVTCHGGVINVWAAHAIGFPPRFFFNPDYTSINRFMCARSGERSVITLNEAVHLWVYKDLNERAAARGVVRVRLRSARSLSRRY